MTTQELHEKYGEQKVLVLHESLLKDLPSPIASSFYSSKKWTPPYHKGEPMLRYLAETDPTHKQLVGYTLLRQAGTDRIFVTERIAGDHRLIGKCSLGTGGHVEPGEAILTGILRELKEEVGVAYSDISDFSVLGFIYDDSSEVNSVHFGIVPLVTVPEQISVAVRETEKLRGHWMCVESVKALRDAGRLESWSEIVFDAVLAKECV